MRALTAEQAAAESVAEGITRLTSEAERHRHSREWEAVVSALRLALHCIRPMTPTDCDTAA